MALRHYTTAIPLAFDFISACSWAALGRRLKGSSGHRRELKTSRRSVSFVGWDRKGGPAGYFFSGESVPRTIRNVVYARVGALAAPREVASGQSQQGFSVFG